MFLTEEKIAARIQELSMFRYRDSRTLECWRFALDPRGDVGTRPESIVFDRTVKIGDRWQGRDLYAWLCARVTIPAQWMGKRVVGRFNFGRTGPGSTSGFESLLFVDGRPYQGVDSNHQEVFMHSDWAGHTVELQFRLWSGMEAGGVHREQEYVFQMAEIAYLDEDADDLYYTLSAMLQAVLVLDHHVPERIAMLNALDRALRLVDWSQSGSGRFYVSLGHARRLLNHYLDSVPKQQHMVTVYGVGHTHIDVAWLWRLVHTREKCARSFSTVLRLMELYPEYIFLQTQPQLYEYIKSDYPEIYEAMMVRIKQGRWEVGGGMWLEADCNLTSGESLVRQILFGTRFFSREYDHDCTYLWLPDVFGYSWALPQILRKSGIKAFMTTKISWNQYNRMPHDTFIWRGMDGSEVLAHFITTPGSESPDAPYTYNGQLSAKSIVGSWAAYRDKRINQDLLLAYGFGDGGGGVTRDMLEMRRRFNRIPGLPNMVTGRADEYFERLQTTVSQADNYVHTWDGELYLEYHRGTYTSQAQSKRMNRKLELAYRETEWISILARAMKPQRRLGNAARIIQDRLNEGWKIILRNQFHDIIPGSSIREVYEDSFQEYAVCGTVANEVWQAGASDLLIEQRDVFTVFNSAGWNRTAIARIPLRSVGSGGQFVDGRGNVLLAQQVEEEWWVLAEEVPALGVSVIRYVRNAENPLASSENRTHHQKFAFQVDNNTVSTPFYDIIWNDAGQLTGIFDKSVNREVLPVGARGNVLQVFEDKPLAHDAWDIDLFYQEKMREIDALVAIEVVTAGPVCAIIRFSWQYGESTISQRLVTYGHSHQIDFVTKVDWHERQQLLKVAFPVEVRSVEATFDVQFGNVRRPTHWNTSWDFGRFESVGHQWADLSETGYGVSLANDCKYGYDIKNNTIRLSLLRAAIHPDTEADQGVHEFTYSLMPHAGNWLEGETVRLAWDLNSPLRAEAGQPVKDRVSLFRLSSKHAMVDAIKLAEDDDRIVLRLHEFAGGRETVTVTSDFTVVSWQECDLMERPIRDTENGAFSFLLHPYEIKTFLVEMTGGLVEGEFEKNASA
ncbi:MAG: alpha-mannosidase [Thermaerobacter sp.]|nr:alpha-mannosidase [Thermaerobacter sp.]